MQTCIWSSWCHCHSLSLASVKSRLVLPFWYRLTWVVPDKGLLNGCVCGGVVLSLNSLDAVFVVEKLWFVVCLSVCAYVSSALCLLNSQMVLSLNSQDAGVYRNSEAECVSLCHVARLHADQVIGSLSSYVFNICLCMYCIVRLPSVLWRCWLGVRKSIRPVKIEWWGVDVVICLERGADCLHMV